jgi:hypothetical protein
MDAYCLEVCKLEDKIWGIELHHVPLRDNNDADALAKKAAQWDPAPTEVFVKDLHTPLIRVRSDPPPRSSDLELEGSSRVSPEQTTPGRALGGPDCFAMEGTTSATDAIVTNPDWRAPLLAYLLDEVLPPDKIEARSITRGTKTFVTIDGELYKQNPSPVGMLMKCVPIQQSKELLLEIHAGICGHHAAPWPLVGKAFRQDFGWPTALRDAEEVVHTCKGCQFYAWQTNLPTQALQTIPLTWPFAVWGLDMVGPLKKAPGGFTHLLIVVDKFTKWIEAKPIVKPSSQEVVKFFLDIVYHFVYPTLLSRTMEPTSQARSSWISLMDTESRSTGRRLDTLAPMGKWKERIAWSSRDLSLASSTSSTSLPAGG